MGALLSCKTTGCATRVAHPVVLKEVFNRERTRPGLVIGTNAGRIILTLVRENMALTMDRDP